MIRPLQEKKISFMAKKKTNKRFPPSKEGKNAGDATACYRRGARGRRAGKHVLCFTKTFGDERDNTMGKPDVMDEERQITISIKRDNLQQRSWLQGWKGRRAEAERDMMKGVRSGRENVGTEGGEKQGGRRGEGWRKQPGGERQLIDRNRCRSSASGKGEERSRPSEGPIASKRPDKSPIQG